MDAVETVWEFVAAINGRDPDGMSLLMTDDHTLVDSMDNTITGRDEVSDAWRSYFHMFPDYRIDVTNTFVSSNRVVLLGESTGTYSGKHDPSMDPEVEGSALADIRRQHLRRQTDQFEKDLPMRETFGVRSCRLMFPYLLSLITYL